MKKSFLMVGQVLISVILIGVMIKLALVTVSAAQFSSTVMRFDRMKVSSPSSVLVYFVPATVGTEAKVKVVFGAGVVLGAGISATTLALPAGITGMPGTLAITGAGQSAVVTIGELTVGTTYGFVISAGVSTPSGAGQVLNSVSTLTAADAVIDSTTVASRFITDDQIVITGNVPPTFNFTLVGNTDSFTADLSTSVVSTNGRAVQVTTNAAKGWIGWVKSANIALSSASAGVTIPTVGTINNAPNTCPGSADCYVLDANITTTGTGTGSLTIDGEYNGADTSSGGTLSNTYQPFARRTGITDGDTITLVARAAVSGSKEAASDYTDTLTVVGAGNF